MFIRRAMFASTLLLASSCSNDHGHPGRAPGSPPAPASGQDHSAHALGPAGQRAPAALSGYAGFSLPPEQAARAGLKTAEVVEQSFQRVLRTSGVVVLDETRTAHVHTKVRGWIESVSADFVGKKVRAGAPLCSIYSQEVHAAELEYLSIFEQVSVRAVAPSGFAELERKASDQLLAAARRRLSSWDVGQGEIERLEQTRTARRAFTLAAPRSGIIVAKQALAGMYVDQAAELYVISDTSRLWLLADIYERDVPFVKLGDPAKLSIEGSAAPELEATVAFIPPTVDEATRTLRARFDLTNSEDRIRPGAFASVEMRLDLGRALAVPETAVIHAGARDIVFVVHGAHVEPRAVAVGPLVEGRYPVREGLSAGEVVAVGAQFLIDSESRLRASSAPGGAHAGH